MGVMGELGIVVGGERGEVIPEGREKGGKLHVFVFLREITSWLWKSSEFTLLL